MRLIGSKARQRKNILPIINRYPRELYVEAFGGAGGLFFGKKPEPAEVYNDANSAFVSLMRCVRSTEKLASLEWILELTPVSRELWYEARDMARFYMRGQLDEFLALKKTAGLDEYENDVVAAFSVFYAQNCGFGGSFLHSFGGGGTGQSANGTIHVYETRREALRQYCRRLRTVSIENLDALDWIDKYDHRTTLFYLDPPYIMDAPHSDSDAKVYGGNNIDNAALVEKLLKLKGSFVLSCYDDAVFAPLREVAKRHEFVAMTTVCQKAEKNGTFDRLEVVYASKIDERRLF